jgi:hypothetical protein
MPMLTESPAKEDEFSPDKRTGTFERFKPKHTAGNFAWPLSSGLKNS